MSQAFIEHIAIDAHGVARIAGSRSRVSQIVVDKVDNGMTPEAIVDAYPHLSLSDVYAALTYYYDNRDRIDEEIREGKRLYEEGLQKQRTDPAFRSLLDSLKQRSNQE